MKKRFLMLVGLLLVTTQAFAQQKAVTGKVTNDQDAPLAGAQIIVKGTGSGTLTNDAGDYTIRASAGQVLSFSYLGYATVERTIGAANVINVQLRTSAVNLEAVEVTALGQTARRRSLGTSQQTVKGVEIAQTQRSNFVNSLQGRVAGVDVVSSSGVPGASSSIVIRGISSISSSNQPLMIVDGLPVDNKTVPTAIFASDAPNSPTAIDNRGIDFTNRAADFNPEDIETLTVLKGPEASALYGIDAANGAIVITTKRGRAGIGGLEYSNSISVSSVRDAPEVQHVYGPSTLASTTFQYFGTPYPSGTRFYNNIDGFFQTAVSQKHNLSFSGASADNRLNYRLSGGTTREEGNIPNTEYKRLNLTASSQAQVLPWLNADLVMNYSYDTNTQPLRGSGRGPLLGLLVWPDTIDAKEWLTPAGTRTRLTSLSAASEVDNPYFAVNKNDNSSKNNRLNLNLGLSIAPFSWGYLKTNIGSDAYTTQYKILRHPESSLGFTNNGILDLSDDVTRNLNAQTVFNFNRYDITSDLSVSAFVGNSITNNRSEYAGLQGLDFLDPNFVSINNTDQTKRSNRTSLVRRRLVSAFGQVSIDYRDYLYVNVTGRNDWTSTIPVARNSFFYPSVSASFVFSDAFPSVRGFLTSGKLRAAYAEVGRDAQPYAFRPALENKLTTHGGYGYSFWGPNLSLKPEFAKSYELGAELGFLDDRLGVDVAYYKKRTEDQIVQNIRGSYATGFVLFNLNGATTENHGLELTLRGTPVLGRDFSWDILTNFTRARGKTVSLPHDLPELYNSDTWLYENVRNGTMPGLSTMSLTGRFLQRVQSDSAGMQGQVLIDPTTGLPLRTADFVDRGFDRQPDFTIGLANTFKYKRLSLNFLLDIRKGGDVFNATQHFLTTIGLAANTVDRETPRVIQGVLRDGNENSQNPTINTIEIVPALQTDYYTGMNPEEFIEKDINWLRMRDVTLTYMLPQGFLTSKNASVYVTATELFLFTNYTGLDPIVNGNTAATGGSGGVGIDFGNFPMPRTFNFGVKVGF